ncbi:H+-transporting ATPase [Raphidocelis subcapitata]|uniref:Plasma membrane ATPase n=1 Tax=Raphidocelis subcapitata TaxID=307507 RepID=A0A2V0P215_9CHLO|nr:H+-transporting ATPase [Raphidocelis subcapitata]|eukprot:GBF93619.1 H+-transporting ATPase [Raphidocelis subcapitata]
MADENPPVEEATGKVESKSEPKKDFVPSVGLTTEEAEELTKEWGRNELEEKKVPKWLVFLKMLIQPMPVMIWIAIIIMLALEHWIDFAILMAIQFINAFLGWYETVKAADAVAALKASLKPTATVKRDGKWQNMDAALLVPGDMVLLAAGSSIPADCLVNHGRIEVDQSALTGESLPVTMYAGDSAKMGSTVTRGEVEGTVEFTGKHTFFGKTATMLQQADGMGHLQKILMQITLALVVLSVVLCFTALGYLIGYGKEPVREALSFTVVLLVASIPIAIEIVCTTTLALGSRQLSQEGAIVTRLASIEEMAGMNMLCSDKTGTLTLNKMVIQDDCPIYTAGETMESVLKYAALAAKWKEPPRDALDTLVLTSAKLDELDSFEQIDFLPFDPTIKRTEGTLRGPDGKVFKTTKGAPHIILKLIEIDSEEVAKRVNWKVMDLGRRGIRSLAVAKTNEAGKWHMLGILTFLDPPRPDTKETIENSMALGVDVKMITGDHQIIAKETARQLGLGTNIPDAANLPTMDADGKIPKDLGKKYGKMILEADGFAQVYPEHKYLIVEALRQAGFACGMTGDGVNDAPALKRADVGIAVQGATDAARAAADMVLTREGLSVIVHAIVVARCIFARMKNFINYRIACTLQLLLFFFIAIFAIHPHSYMESWDPTALHFFKMPVLFLMLITVLNDGTLITVAYDNVNPSKQPEKWNLVALWAVSIVLSIVALLSSLLLLWAAVDSGNPGSLFSKMGLPRMDFDQVVTMIYLKVSLSDFLTLFSARTHDGFFWSSRPSWMLSLGACISMGISTLIACLWPPNAGDFWTDKIKVRGLALSEYKLWPLWVWIYCVVWWWIQDLCKVAFYWLMRKTNMFYVNTSTLVNVRDKTTFGAKDSLARMSAGMVEGKLLEMKVDKAADSVQRAAAATNEPHLRRASQDLALVRNSVRLARTSLGGQAPKDAEGGASAAESLARMQQAVSQIEKALEAASAEDRAAIQSQLESVRQTAERMAAIDKQMRVEKK